MPYGLIIEGIADLDARWKVQVRDRIVIGCQVAVMRAATAGANLARQLVPVSASDRSEVNTRGVHLRDKIYATLLSSTINIESHAFKSVAAEIKADAPYASYVENGTRPHDIPAGKGGWLAWENPGAQGDWHFAKVVHHPGTKPHPYMGPAFLAAERELERQVTMFVEAAVENFNRD